MKKILIINNGLAGGGIERSSIGLANYFAKLGHNITVLALYQSEHFYDMHASIKFIEPEFKRKEMSQHIYVLKMIMYARKHIKQIKPDTILSYSEWSNPYIVLSTLGLRIPLFLSDRMSPLAKLPFTSEMLKRFLYKQANGIIAQTSFAKEILLKKTKSKHIIVISNPVNAVERVSCEPKNRIVSIGRLSSEKGHRYLLEAFAQTKTLNWELSIVGDGVEREKLELLADNLGIADRVIFNGYLKDFSLQLSEAQIFVLPSLIEGFPNALLEAMSIPLACIATDFSRGKNEIIDHESNGLVVKAGNTDELAQAIQRLINNKNLRENLAKEAFRVREDYNFERIANLYLNFILDDHS